MWKTTLSLSYKKCEIETILVSPECNDKHHCQGRDDKFKYGSNWPSNLCVCMCVCACVCVCVCMCVCVCVCVCMFIGSQTLNLNYMK